MCNREVGSHVWRVALRLDARGVPVLVRRRRATADEVLEPGAVAAEVGIEDGERPLRLGALGGEQLEGGREEGSAAAVQNPALGLGAGVRRAPQGPSGPVHTLLPSH